MNKFKPGFFGLLGAAITGLTILSLLLMLRNQSHRRAAAELARDQVIQVNDSTRAVIAQLTADKEDLWALLDAAKSMDGKLVAGVRVVIKRDTIYVPVREVVTVAHEDGSRTATKTDTLPGGYHLRIDATAPPFPAPLQLGYNLETPEFAPEVGFVQRGKAYYAVVTWSGQTYQVKGAFYRQPARRPLRLVAGANGALHDTRVTGDLYTAVAYTLSDRDIVKVGAHYAGDTPFLGIGYERTLW